MKNKLKFFIATLIMFCTNVVAQNDGHIGIGPDGKQNLAGKWEGICSVQYLDHATMRMCNLCPFEINESDKSLSSTHSFEITFGNDSINLNRNGKKQMLAYTINKDTHSISFIVENYIYKFSVAYSEKGVILVDADGFVIELKRK